MSCTNLKISEMPFTHCIKGNELVPIVQDGENKVTTVDHLFPSHGPCDKKPCNEWNPNWDPCGKGPWDKEPMFRPHEDDLVKKAFSKATVAQADSELALTKIQELNFALDKLRAENYDLTHRVADLEGRLNILETRINQNNG